MQDFDNGLTKPFEEGLLLTSLINFKPLIEHILTTLKIRSICEIGIDRGLFSDWLIQFIKQEKIRYMGIDPKVPEGIKERLSKDEYTEGKSIPFLKDITDPYDLYFIDGDHNYYTVENELKAIEEKADNKFPVCILHDINWPWGRRDFYYNVDDIPEDYRQPATQKGAINIGNTGISDRGFRAGSGNLIAQKEGGKRNGILTAVEDFMAAYKKKNGRDLTLVKVPVFFGLGILYDPKFFSKSQRKELENIENMQGHIKLLLKQMEHNRASLVLELIHLRGMLRRSNALLKAEREKNKQT
ncbi:MAG: class I SAM-dependent methyltransferase [Alphaproteobacteria bacterium]